MQESSKHRSKAAAQRDAQTRQWSRLAVLKSSWWAALRIDRTNITAFQAIRSTLGMAVPLVLGIVTNQPAAGVLLASGALMLGSVGLKDPYQARGRAMLLAGLFITLSALTGGLIGGLGWLPVAVIGGWGIVAGMFASLSQVAQIVGVQACAALIVYTHLQLDPLHAVLTAGLVCAGTLIQIVLALVPSPWKNTIPERTTLATIYQKLADYAAHSSREQDAVQMSEALLAGHTVLLNGDTRSEKGQMFARLLEEAEHLRLTLSVLIGEQEHLRENESTKNAGACLEQMVRTSGEELRVIAQALKLSVPSRESESSNAYDEIKKGLAHLRAMAQGAEEIQHVLPYCSALLGEMHIARRLAGAWRYARRYWPLRIHFPYPRPPQLHLESARANLRANLTLHSGTFRHAVRLGVTLATGTALYQIFHLPIERGYWIPMTAALVLRSDFITTYTRGTARLLGTVLGAVLTTLLVTLLAPSPALLAVVVIIATYLMYATLLANYTIFSLATTMAVVFLLSFIHAPTLTTAADRALDTVIGGLLALLIYLIWPTWERSQVAENIARRLEMLARYFDVVMQVYIDPGTPPIDAFDKRHLESRLARSNALGSVQRALQEPAHQRNAELATNILAAADNLSRCVLALEAYQHDNPRHYTLCELAAFRQAIDESLSKLAAALRAAQPAATLPDLRAALHQLKCAVKADKQAQAEPEGQNQWRFVLEQARRMVQYIQAMQQLLATAVARQSI